MKIRLIVTKKNLIVNKCLWGEEEQNVKDDEEGKNETKT